ncbi:DHA2 family efflux MFS transporter permease subunit [Blastomonas sp.]|uniref:DHA2 family efflux MFS transporter permease subunit n=1 Tax=Blastomonas sp. TaxID=1909299 RepID=UPI002582E8CD|nr:DHA2 family efflux MFS transporter permease subunit [Blastomonas sp.]
MASRAAPARFAGPAPGALPIDLPAMPVRHRGLLTLAVMMATIMQILDTTIANVALPHMQSSLGATADTVTWALTSYLVASAIAMPITGWLAERVGSRNLFVWAVIAFTLASMACGAAATLEEMVLFRAIQGIAAAFIGPLSQTVLMDINPPSGQARAMSIWGMGIMIGPIMGPVLGGWLTESYSWRWVFLVNVPVGIVTIALLAWLLPSRERTRRRFDLFGFSMLALGLAAMQIMLDRGTQLDWFSSPEILIEAAISIACLWIFAVHMIWGRNPLFERGPLGNRNMAAALLFMLVVGVVMFASMALLPPMLQQLFGYSVLDTGLLLAPRGLGILISMGVAGRLVNTVDPRYLMITGAATATYSLWMMTGWSLDMTWHPIVVAGFVQGIGMGLVFIPLNFLAFATLEPRHRTDGASLLNLARSLGASVSISVLTTLLSFNIQVSHSDLAAHITGSSLSMLDPGTADKFGSLGDAALLVVNAQINRQAAMIAYIDDFHAMMLVNLAAIPLLLLLRRPKVTVAGPAYLGE